MGHPQEKSASSSPSLRLLLLGINTQSPSAFDAGPRTLVRGMAKSLCNSESWMVSLKRHLLRTPSEQDATFGLGSDMRGVRQVLKRVL